mgnify:FL=1
MVLLIIADDFTGALDTGVQFAARGIKTRVVVGADAALTHRNADVLVVDTETRHLPAAKAYEAVERLVRRAGHAGFAYLYKKTDSALRGNVGAELAALLNASGSRQLAFLPAFPQMNRVTKNGVQYIDGVPVTESPFGVDPFEPVRHAAVTELLAEQTDLPAAGFPALAADGNVPAANGILIFDAATVEDLRSTGRALLNHGRLHVLAGCAGFAAVLPELLGLGGADVTCPTLDPRLLVICGSVNAITLAQLDKAEQAGFTRLRLTPHQKLTPDYWYSEEGQAALKKIEETLAAHPYNIIETNDEGGNEPTTAAADALGLTRGAMRVRIAGGIGQLVGAIFASPSVGTLLLTGGDTLLQCMNSVGVHELEPICEMERGVVLARFGCNGTTRYVITKSGGFGQANLLTKLAKQIAADTEETT